MATAQIIPLEEGWSKIKTQGLAILEDFLNTGSARSFTTREFSELYSTVYNMCTQRSPYNWSEQLYNRYGESMSTYLTQTVLPVLKERHNEYLLEELVKRWESHKIMVKWMQRFFQYLDRYYVKHHSLPQLKDKGIKIFRTLVFEEVKKDVRQALLAVITREREGEVVDRMLIKSTIEIFIEIGMSNLEVYISGFEDHFLAATAEYYSVKTRGWISEDSCPEYMEKAEKCLNDELIRVQSYLHSSTEPKLMKACETELLAAHEAALLEKETGIVWLLNNHKRDDLARMCRLFIRVPEGLPAIALAVRKHITDIGNAVVDQRENQLQTGVKDNPQDPQFIQALLDLHDTYRAMVNECFSGNSLFQKALKEAFEVFVNRDVGKITNAELMSTFCDRVLKKTGERLSDEAVEDTLEKVVNLFSYLTDKDLFAEIYRNQLAKRLLFDRSASDDAERSMIAKLKLRCGAQFTSKMEGMITDLTLANDTQKAFSEWLRGNRKDAGGIDFSVTVLTTGFWPTYKIQDVPLPNEMVRCVNLFKPFYDSRTSHRRLQWVYSLGTASVAGMLGGRRYDFVVSTLQACILLFFSETDDWISFATILENLKLGDEICKRLLHSLSCGKFRILDKEPDSKVVNSTDQFRANVKFASQQRKIKVPLPPMEESHNKERVVEDRSIAIEAAIVRIMKSRKMLPHVQLVQEVLHQLAFFKPNPKVIKQRIEHLIEREYLERDSSQPNVYKYLA